VDNDQRAVNQLARIRWARGRFTRWLVGGAIFFALSGVLQLALDVGTLVVLVSFGLAVLCAYQVVFMRWIERRLTARIDSNSTRE
jgi:hypothetical protein